jgi:pimeloyl-ACP methyl ester carboxylesterase
MGKVLRILAALALVAVLVGAATFYLHPLWVNDKIVDLNLRGQNVQSRYIDVDGYKLHYFEGVPPARLRVMGDGMPLLLIHGLGSRGEDWSAMIPSLADAGFHVYVPDLLGYGRSPQPDVSYSIAMEEKIVVDFLKAVHVDKTDVGGWSMGGWIALKLTADHPELVKRLVLYDAAGIYFPPTFDAALFTPNDPAGLARLSAMLSPHPKPIPDFAARAVIRRLQKNGWVIARSFTEMASGKDLMDFRLNDVKRPTLLVWGGSDRLIPPSVAQAMHRGIAGSSLLMVEGCGHLAASECAKPVIDGTLKFLEAHPPIVGGESAVDGTGKKTAH